MSLLPLKTTVKPIDDNQKEHFVTYRVRTSTQDPSDFVTLSIRHFDYGNGEEWLTWRKQFEYIRLLKGWQEAIELYQNIRILLQSSALVRFESVNSTIMGMEDVEHCDEALRRMAAMYFPKRPASKVRQYLRETRKPSNMSVEEYVARLHQINELIQFLPPPNNRLTNPELREIVESNMPAVWQKKYDESGQDYETLEELVAYFRQLEEAEGQQRPPHQDKSNKSSTQQPKQGSHRGSSAEQKRSKKQADAPRKWCEFHKPRSHDTSEWRAKNKSKEEAHFIDVEVAETCYNIEESVGDTSHQQRPTEDQPAKPAPAPKTCAPTASSDDQVTTELLVSIPLPSGKTRLLPDFTTNRVVNHAFFVTAKAAESRGYDCIIGRNLILALKLKFDFEQRTIAWHGLEVPMHTCVNLTAEKYSYEIPASVHAAETRMVRIRDAKYAKVDLDLCIPSHLDEKQQQSLQQLLQLFDDLNEGTIGTMPGEPYDFELKPGAQPFHDRPFGIPHAYLEAVRKEVACLEALGVVVRDSSSSWAAPVFIIPKKDKTARFLTDFRRLNSMIIRHPFLIPKITELLQGLERLVFVTSLDMNMGY